MKKLSIEDRATLLAHYIIETKDTVRSTAKKFGVSYWKLSISLCAVSNGQHNAY